MQHDRNCTRGYEDYTVAVIGALGFEMSAVRYVLIRNTNVLISCVVARTRNVSASLAVAMLSRL